MARGPILPSPDLGPLEDIARQLFMELAHPGLGDHWRWRGTLMKVKSRQVPTWSFHGRSTTAARWAYELFIGPLDAGVLVLRTCDEMLCVNPSHLTTKATRRVEEPVEVIDLIEEPRLRGKIRAQREVREYPIIFARDPKQRRGRKGGRGRTGPRTVDGILALVRRSDGWEYERVNGGHIMVSSPEGRRVRISATPSDSRTPLNDLARLRRVGLDPEG